MTSEREELIEAEMFKIESTHHFHGDECLCGFKSARSRSRTEHITGLVRSVFEQSVTPTNDERETVEQARDRLMPEVLAYARMEGLSEVGIAAAALRIGITDARRPAHAEPSHEGHTSCDRRLGCVQGEPTTTPATVDESQNHFTIYLPQGGYRHNLRTGDIPALRAHFRPQPQGEPSDAAALRRPVRGERMVSESGSADIVSGEMSVPRNSGYSVQGEPSDMDRLLADADALVSSWDQKGSWYPDSPVGMVMQLAAALRATFATEQGGELG